MMIALFIYQITLVRFRAISRQTLNFFLVTINSLQRYTSLQKRVYNCQPPPTINIQTYQERDCRLRYKPIKVCGDMKKK